MRLATIKLAGFKSFVDPTTLHLPTNLTAVVGPNGCGKSNIIDAVKWVLGESAASRLRGDAMTDVIFNGTTERKPVGQATVELIFDNSDGTVLGEFAGWSEISVKRQVGRDGQSQYWLNGTRCRRRDVTDLFLGTGLGPRSYAIIEQGMISQIVEAAPDDLRVHLEEAAGISKYKERRRETEARMRATRENLERLTDVRDEVDKQLEHLKRQAKQAERWTELRNEQRRIDAQAKALAWLDVSHKLEVEVKKLSSVEEQVLSLDADHARNELELEQSREKHREAAEYFRSVQAEHYQVGGDITRIEQQLNFGRQSAERLATEMAEAQAQRVHLDEQLALDRQQMAILQHTLDTELPQLAALAQSAKEAGLSLQGAEQAIGQWQLRSDQVSRQASEATKSAEVQRTRIEMTEQQVRQQLKRRDVLEQEQKLLAGRNSAAEMALLKDTQSQCDADVAVLTAALNSRKAELVDAEKQQRELQSTIARERQNLSAMRGRLASLEALQHAALGEDKRDLAQWLKRHGLDHAPRLGTLLTVEPGYERAVEAVLGHALEALVVDDAAQSLDLDALPKGVLMLASRVDGIAASADTLAAKVTGPAVIQDVLGTVRVVDDTQGAIELSESLAPGTSIVTRSGECFGRHWRRIDKGSSGHEGVIARGREIAQLKDEVRAADESLVTAEQSFSGARQALQTAETAREAAQTALYAAHRKAADAAGRVRSVEGRVEQERLRQEAIRNELAQIATQTSEAEQKSKAARSDVSAAMDHLNQLNDERAQLDQERIRLVAARDAARERARSEQERERHLALNVEGKRTAANSLQAAIARIAAQLDQLLARAARLGEQHAQTLAPLPALEANLNVFLDQRVLVEQRLTSARQQLETLDLNLRKLDMDRQRIDHQLNQAREKRGRSQLDEQALRIKAEALEQTLSDAGFERDTVVASLPEGADLKLWESQLIDLEQRIKRLEPVNLAAINELEEQSQRKIYLDSQHADLTEALNTLEDAIRKIDRETRTRFKETFDRVNAGVQELFPRLFGGGHAYLELTGEDLLSTGVNIIARPPGKKPASIGLLSGGEKALTAVSLVFSIFRLNPAPFCLLDEVDAPLDEANVGRFSQMVSEMSKGVQFLVVTHNKVTMESVNHLAGVTMREPGVSRLVSVDLAEATRLTGV